MKKLETIAEQKAFLDSFDNFLFDCDGVLWEGSSLIPGVDEAMKRLRSKGKRLFFVTNNSTKSRESILQKFRGFGIEADISEMFSSAFATAAYLKNIVKFPAHKKVYIVGMEGIRQELGKEGIRTCGGDEDDGIFDGSYIPDDPEVGAVVVGLDMHVTYLKYAKAFVYLRNNPDCHFILTNADSTFPNNGNLLPGSGSIAMPLMHALKRQPDVILGKPALNLMETIFAQYNLEKAKTCMVGDRLDTDIDFGLKGGITTLCVLTGVTHEKELLAPENAIRPTYYINSFADFANV